MLASLLVALVLTVLTLCQCGSSTRTLAALADEELLVGWRGETYSQSEECGQPQQAPAAERWLETLAWSPRAFVFVRPCDTAVPWSCAQFKQLASV